MLIFACRAACFVSGSAERAPEGVPLGALTANRLGSGARVPDFSRARGRIFARLIIRRAGALLLRRNEALIYSWQARDFRARARVTTRGTRRPTRGVALTFELSGQDAAGSRFITVAITSVSKPSLSLCLSLALKSACFFRPQMKLFVRAKIPQETPQEREKGSLATFARQRPATRNVARFFLRGPFPAGWRFSRAPENDAILRPVLCDRMLMDAASVTSFLPTYFSTSLILRPPTRGATFHSVRVL